MNTNYTLIILLSLPILLLVLFLISKILPKNNEEDKTREKDKEDEAREEDEEDEIQEDDEE